MTRRTQPNNGPKLGPSPSPFAFLSAQREGLFIPQAWRRTLALLLVLLSGTVLAETQAFDEDSLAQLEARHSGQPFVLMLWSLDCPPCIEELAGLQAQGSTLPPNGLVLLNTDRPARRAEAEQLLRRYHLEGIEQWGYAHDYEERLRFHVDPAWFGELPRSYYYDATGRRRGHSGVQTPERLQQWLQQGKG